MGTVTLKIDFPIARRTRLPVTPYEPILSWVGPVRPNVGRPGNPWCGVVVVVQIAGDRIDSTCPDLVDLCLNERLGREPILVSVRFGIQITGGIAGVNAGGQKRQL